MRMLRLALMLGLMAGVGRSSAQAALSGRVTGPDGTAIKDAKVMLLGRNLTVHTDASGQYVFTGIPTGFGTIPSPLPGAAGENGPHLKWGRPLFTGPVGHGEGFGLFDAAGRWNGVSAPVGIPTALEKQAAGEDTLSVIALGFERGERPIAVPTGSQDFKLNAIRYTNIAYKTGALTAAEKAYCIFDIHKPASGTHWPVVIHLHGGGLTGGDRNEAFTGNNHFGQKFLDAGVLEVAPGYRLIRKGGTFPDYIRDAAQAAIWVRKNIECYGGDPNSVFISGFSAGAYLTHMLSVDSVWFNEAKYDPRHFAGFISMSGQTRVHDSLQMDLRVSNIMAEAPWAVPMGNIRKTTIPWQIIVGGNEGHTVTDNQALYDACIKAGSTDLYIDIFPGLGHEVGDMGNAVSPKRDRFLAFIAKYKGRGI